MTPNNELFVTYVEGRYDRTKKAKEQNKSSRKMIELTTEMVKNGSIMELRDLLTHENNAVKCHAAFYLLPFSQEEAVTVLKELAAQKGSIVFWEAKDFLRDYTNGNLKFPHCNNK